MHYNRFVAQTEFQPAPTLEFIAKIVTGSTDATLEGLGVAVRKQHISCSLRGFDDYNDREELIDSTVISFTPFEVVLSGIDNYRLSAHLSRNAGKLTSPSSLGVTANVVFTKLPPIGEDELHYHNVKPVDLKLETFVAEKEPWLAFGSYVPLAIKASELLDKRTSAKVPRGNAKNWPYKECADCGVHFSGF